MKRHPAHNRRRNLRIECLESRTMLAADLIDGVLAIPGTDLGDEINVEMVDSDVQVTVNGETSLFASDQIDRINIQGGAGDDIISIAQDVLIRSKIRGGRGDDNISGGGARDIITGGRGDDVISGGQGNDVLKGGAGEDTIFGGAGRDRIRGNAGNDLLVGGHGHDRIRGGKGIDQIEQNGADQPGVPDNGESDQSQEPLIPGVELEDGVLAISGSDLGDEINVEVVDRNVQVTVNGDTSLFAADDIDRVFIQGGAGDDIIAIAQDVHIRSKIRGGRGDDNISGGGARDIIIGGRGDDVIFGGQENDVLKGGAGDDTIYGETGRDRIWGNAGGDLLVGGQGHDRIRGGKGIDLIYQEKANLDEIFDSSNDA